MITITPGDPRDPQATALLQASHTLMQSLFDAGDCHYLEISDLCVPSVQFFVAQKDKQTVGCAALSNKGDYAEIKSMFVDPNMRGLGIADLLINHLLAEAKELGVTDIKLETGNPLEAAIRLYKRHGFVECTAFGEYETADASVFMTKPLGA